MIIMGGFFIVSLKSTKPKPAIALLPKTTAKKIYYPRQYSDIHYPKSISEANTKYKDTVVFDKNLLLASVISSVSNNTGNINGGEEVGTWLWTPVMDITPAYKEFVISGAKQNGIKTIYLSIDSYLDIFLMPNGEKRDKSKLAFDNAVEKFIADAHKDGISVDAEAGWQNWAEFGNLYKPLAVLDYVIAFNKSHPEKFRGFQYDVESYLLPQYEENKQVTLYNFVNLVDQTVAKLNNTDLLLSVVVPDFYDSDSNETPEYSYRGENGFTFDHLLRVLDRRSGSKLVVMSYRNFSRGDDGSIDISKGEIKDALLAKTKVVIAQETGNVQPSYVTFYSTNKSYLDKQKTNLASAFEGYSSFGGFAVHYINSYLDLK